MIKKRFFLLAILLTVSITVMQAQCFNCDPGSSASGDFSTAIGHTSTASGFASFAAGAHSVAAGSTSLSLGLWNVNTEDAYYSTTIGSYCKTTANSAMVFGAGISENNFLINNQSYSLIIGFNSTKPTFFVSTSPGPGTTGKIAIGNVINENGYMDPKVKLHLRADEGEEAAVFIEPHSWDEGDSAVLYLGNKQNSIYSGKAEGIVYATQQNHIFTGGDVYIEDIDKGIIMKSPDGKCWRGTLDNSGSLQFTQLDACPGNTTSVVESKMSYHGDMTVFPNPTDHFITVKLKENSFSKNRKLKAIIIDQYGNEILSTTFNGPTVGFYTADLPVGSYFVKVTDGNHAITKQFVKK